MLANKIAYAKDVFPSEDFLHDIVNAEPTQTLVTPNLFSERDDLTDDMSIEKAPISDNIPDNFSVLKEKNSDRQENQLNKSRNKSSETQEKRTSPSLMPLDSNSPTKIIVNKSSSSVQSMPNGSCTISATIKIFEKNLVSVFVENSNTYVLNLSRE